MEWVKDKKNISNLAKVPIKSWCKKIEPGAMEQAINLAMHPSVFSHVALMPDCHVGYGMPIGGVIACESSVIPNAVGVDIGCGMGAVKTSVKASSLEDKRKIRSIVDAIKLRIPIGEGHGHKISQDWAGFTEFELLVGQKKPVWLTQEGLNRDKKNLGTLGGGNHFIEIQASDEGDVWLMLHSGSRNLGYRVASYYHKLAQQLNAKWHAKIPSSDLAFLPVDSKEGQNYIRDMQFSLAYARENRRRMMQIFKEVFAEFFLDVEFIDEINIHHNYAALEKHFGKKVWVHRKGATSAQKGEMGIIPGSMGASSYIVQGLGNPDSFASCSHGAGRKLGRTQASRQLSLDECNKSMEGIVYDRWHKYRGRSKQKAEIKYDFGEAPQAYKDIDAVIKSELDLVNPVVKLRPLGVIKG